MVKNSRETRVRGKKKSPTAKKRKPIFSDFGEYLRYLRIEKNVTRKDLAKELGLSVHTVRNVEEGYNVPPSPERLRIWMGALRESSNYPKALRLLRQTKNSRQVLYKIRSPATEHIDRLLDAYESGRLSATDLQLLQLISPGEYD